MSCLLSAALVSMASTSGGCALLGEGASAGTATAVDLDAPVLDGFAVASMTDLERDVRIETGKPDRKPVTPITFWTGIGLGAAMSAASIGFGVAGYVAKNDLADAYAGDASLTEEQRDDLVSRGEAYNTTAATTAAFAAMGFAMALVSYAVDWNRCGPLVSGKRTDKKHNRRCDIVESAR
ncbi:hypothetical protein PPSIR1_19509 [Plesiocystis pacifica SIR-1]|uniref:Uncharacterized protein n=1 Tax=Plesiocystis pacifica SIR-1 TaxID=391625 RepID=A6GAK1_9BACT|nr:hypothetical protein PPSIR1_19509 [Plesiocystis pacifica SIR-1]